MNETRVNDAPSREVMLEWIRNQDPYARLAHFTGEDGVRMTALLVTTRGEEHEFAGADEDAVLLECVNALRALHKLPPLGAPSKRDALEQAIVLATFHGDDARAATLTRDLILERSVRPALPMRVKRATRSATW